MKMKKSATVVTMLFSAMVFSQFALADGGPEPKANSLMKPSDNTQVIQGTFTANYDLDEKKMPKGYRILVEMCMTQLQPDDSDKKVCNWFSFKHSKFTPNKWFSDFSESELKLSYNDHINEEGVLEKFGYDPAKYQGVITRLKLKETFGKRNDYERGWAKGEVTIRIVPK